MLSMKAQMDVICCKSIGTDLSMLDIEDFISEICQLKKEVASLEAKLRERGDKPNREDLEKVSVCVTDGTEAQDSVWRSRDTQDSELSLTLLCYTDAQDHGSADQTSDCNAGEQQMLQTPLKMCSVKLVDCRNLIESRGEKNTAEEQKQRHEKVEDEWNDDENDGTEAQDPVWSVRDQRSRDTRDSELNLSFLCYTDAQDHGSADQTSDCNAGEQQMLQTPLKMCSVKLVDCRNLIESRGEKTTAEEQQQRHEEDEDGIDDYNEEEDDEDQNDDDDQIKDEDEDQNDDDFILSDDNIGSSSDGETASTSKQRQTRKSFSCGKIFSKQENLVRHERKKTEQKDFTCKICDISFPTLEERKLHSKEHKKKMFNCSQCGENFNSSSSLSRHKKIHSSGKPFQCSECNKYFHTKGHLSCHKRYHREKKLHHCPHCEKSFNNGSLLKNHLHEYTPIRGSTSAPTARRALISDQL
ncbi:zinc finger and SCAN domain-containing protein 30-like [Chanodichthys erythropterus]|uniref:zinc finger and SCAN domain-containing protein 30-like n=1 Tax=Chanodichthys erythropterus TaxID=933992 RepID=UPI00351DACC0